MIMKFTLKKLRGSGTGASFQKFLAQRYYVFFYARSSLTNRQRLATGKRFPCLYSLVSFPSFFLPEKGKLIDIS